ncbi:MULTISPECIES: hypothetical protein [Streptomyces]|uniref:hypothetical protein n=1 Tax=Streptomyces TaxID=1883 RepID=UPI0031E6A9E5
METQPAFTLRTEVAQLIGRPAAAEWDEREETPWPVAMLQDAAIVAVIAARRWHQFRQHDQQVIAGRRALVHLQSACDHAAVVPLALLSHGKPRHPRSNRFSALVCAAVPTYARQILGGPAWAALAAPLADAEAAGHQPATLPS